ncbi:MAG: polyprenyl diphosphate synthase [Bdellovibrionales bacterium]
MNLPKHIAIIMDGNGRWATARGHNRFWGHIRGAKSATDAIQTAVNLGIENLTLFTFSTENWKRPQLEINFLMRLLTRQLKRELKMLMDNNVRFSCMGDLSRLPNHAQAAVAETILATKNNTGMRLVFALNYSGRQDILNCTRTIASQVARGLLRPEDIDSQVFSQFLAGANQPEPDLIVRTSGEMRLSNFFLWQAAYSELYFCNKLWPEFRPEDLEAAVDSYLHRERRFGKTGDQVKHEISQSTPPVLEC